MEKTLIEIGFDKNGELGFGVLATVQELTLEQLNQLRQMIVVAIWCIEDMWRRNNEPKAGKSDV